MLDATVAEAARRFGERLVWDGWDGRLTYSELAGRASLQATALVARGVSEGDVVVLRMPSSLDYLVAYAANAMVGAITAGLNPKLAPAEQLVLIDGVAPALMVEHPSLDPLPDLAAPTMFCAADLHTDVSGLKGWAGDSVERLPVDPERAVAIVFTSGTTGTPKGALFRNRQLQAVVDIDVGPDAGWGGGAPMLVATHCSHIGLMTKLPWYLRTGSTLVGLERWRGDDVLRAVARHRLPVIGGVAPQMALLVRSALIDELDLTCVRQFVVGGALSSPTLVREIRERFGADYSIRYSSTESGGVGLGTAFDAPDDEALHTIGRPRSGVEARIGNPDADGIGELQLRSPAQMDGYWCDPDATAATIEPDGWMHTGDLARVDETGCFRLAGRLKEMYIRGGYNVFPAEVEAALGDHPLVAELAVTPRVDSVMGEIGVAVVVPRDPVRPPTLEQLRAFGEGRLAPWKLPEALVIVDSLPRTPGEKIDRRAVTRVAS